MLNLANSLTLGRIALIPPLLILMLVPDQNFCWLAFGLYTLIALTDWLDGWVARAMGQMSEFGRFLDPIADKILVGALVVGLTSTGILSGWLLAFPVIILAREFLVSGLREFLGPRGVVIHVTGLAKWKTASQMVALGLLILAPVMPVAEIIGLVLLLVATILTVITGWSYIKSAMPHFQPGAQP